MSIEILRMPKFGMSMSEGKITEWYVNEGDAVDAYDDLLEISTEKITNDVSCSTNGILRKILVKTDETVAVETPLAIIADSSVSDEEINKVLNAN